MNYKEQLTNPLWYAKREEIKLRDLNKCTICSSQGMLQVHHIYYEHKKLAWEYPNECYTTLCHNCHQTIHTSQNPFVKDLIIKIKKVNNINLEEDKKLSLYLNVENRNLLLNLKEISLKLFLIICSNIETNQDEILINETHYVKLLKLRNKKQLREHLENLIQHSFLAKTGMTDVYWINPAISFCGNRLKKYPTNFKERV